MCMYGEVWLWAEPAPTYVAELAPWQTVSKYHVTAPFRTQEMELNMCYIKAHYPFVIII